MILSKFRYIISSIIIIFLLASCQTYGKNNEHPSLTEHTFWKTLQTLHMQVFLMKKIVFIDILL